MLTDPSCSQKSSHKCNKIHLELLVNFRNSFQKKNMSYSTQNREEVPPFYLEVFYRMDGRHNRPYQYEPKEKSLLCNKLELYFWRDSNLKEITQKITETIPFDEAKIPGTRYRNGGEK